MTTKKQQERIDRAERRAAGLRNAADATFDAARKSTEHIPLGQPILVGHHSEKRHRRDLAKRDRLGNKAVALAKEASRASAATAYAGRAITSDDPEALTALREKLAELEAERERAKRLNKLWRKDGGRALREAGVHETTVAAVETTMTRCTWLKVPFDTANLGARIRETKKRIEALEARALEPELPPIACAAFRLEEAKDEDRIRIYFGERIHKDHVAYMKSRGFRWTPSLGCWQRHLGNGRYAAYEAVLTVCRSQYTALSVRPEVFEEACSALVKGVPETWADTVARLVAR